MSSSDAMDATTPPRSLIRDVSEEECKFCEECEMGNFIKRQMNEWDKDGDRKLNAQEFLG